MPDIGECMREANRRLGSFAPARMTLAVPRTAAALIRRGPTARDADATHPPTPGWGPGVAAQMLFDEALLLAVKGPQRFPRRADYERVGAEMVAMRDFLDNEGMLDDPVLFHPEPPPLEDPLVTESRTVLGQRYERLSFESGYLPHEGSPGRGRWLSYHPNRIAHAWVVRHDDDEPRPWLVLVHGFAMGYPAADLACYRARSLAERLGANLVFPVLPLHGPRKVSPLSGEAFMGFEMVNSINGMAQAVWDLRRVVGWARGRGATGVGMAGVSLGSYVASLTAGHVDLDGVCVAVPVTNLPDLYGHHSPRQVRIRSREHRVLGSEANDAWGVVSPLSFPARVPKEGRSIWAGIADRMAVPEQAHQLWVHWDRPHIHWFRGNHGAAIASPGFPRFLASSMAHAGLVAGNAPLDWRDEFDDGVRTA